MSCCEGVRKWLSVSEASESDLPPVDQRLPEGWDEEDILLDEDIAVPATKKQQQQQQPTAVAAKPAVPITISSPKKNNATAVDGAGSPGKFPEGFFASPKNKKSGEFPAATTTTTVNNAKFVQADEDARLKTNAAPSLLSKIAAFLMPQKDGDADAAVSSASPAKKTPSAAAPAAVAAASPAKLTGKRRGRDEIEPSSSPSSSEEEDEVIEGASGDVETKLNSFTVKQLEGKVTNDELKDYARDNNLKYNSKAKKTELIILCKNFAKKQQQQQQDEAAVRASSASPKKQQQPVTVATPAKPVAAPAPDAVVVAPKVRKNPTPDQLSALPPFTVAASDEPQPNWAVTQMKSWAKDNKLNLGDAILKIDILKVCWEAYDKKQKK